MKRVLALLVVAMMLVTALPVAFAANSPVIPPQPETPDEPAREEELLQQEIEDVKTEDENGFFEEIEDVEVEEDAEDGEDEGEDENTEDLGEITSEEETSEVEVSEEDVDTVENEDGSFTETTVSASAIQSAASDSSAKAIAVKAEASEEEETDGVSVALDNDAFSAAADSGKSLAIATDNGTTEFSSSALKAMSDAANGQKVSIERKLTKAAAPEEGKSGFGIGGFVLEMNFKVGSGDNAKKVHELGGEVTLSVELDAKELGDLADAFENMKGDPTSANGATVEIKHIDENGKETTIIATVKLVAGKYVFTFKTKSFSSFVFEGFKTADMLSPVSTSVEAPASTSTNYGMILSVVLGISAAAVFVFTQKKRV